MNQGRILRFTNGLLMLIGYQLHFYDVKTRRFRLSIWAISYFILLSFLYLIAFTHHFEQSALLHLFQDVSPFLKKLMLVHLLLGVKAYFILLYNQRFLSQAANELAKILPEVTAKRFSWKEAYAYFSNFSTLSISVIIILYVAYEMNFELPPLDHILIFLGLSIPHFMTSGALKLYNIGIWFQREQLLNIQTELKRIAPLEEDINTAQLESGNEINPQNSELTSNWLGNIKNTPQDLSLPLQKLYKQLTQLSESAAIFNNTLHFQIIKLVGLNFICLLTGTYARVYYQSTWHVLFTKRGRRIFQATNYGIFILIFCDYLTFCMTQYLFEKVRQNFLKRVSKNIKQRQHYNEETRYILTDMHELLNNGFNFKVLNLFNFKLTTFIVLQIFFAIIIALIVVYHYLHDEIVALSERFDDINTEDN